MNERFFRDKATLKRSYAECVKEGFHPPKGNKTAAEAVTYHEYGHALTDAVAQRMGFTGPGALQMAATSICNEAKAATKHRGVVIMARRISGYATHSNSEAVAEAVADVFCNGNGAKRESRAIVSVIDKYLLR